MSFASNTRICVFNGTHNSRDTRVDQRLRTWSSLTLMSAWLQRNIRRRAARTHVRLTQRFSFRMRSAASLRAAPAGNVPVAINNYTAHGRVRPHTPHPAPRQRERQRHISFVYAVVGARG